MKKYDFKTKFNCRRVNKIYKINKNGTART